MRKYHRGGTYAEQLYHNLYMKKYYTPDQAPASVRLANWIASVFLLGVWAACVYLSKG